MAVGGSFLASQLRVGAATDNCDGDMSQEAEAAQNEGQLYYDAMYGLRQASINLLTVGLFHLLEQQLAKLCYDCNSRNFKLKEANMEGIVLWYGLHFDLNLKTIDKWSTIDELRLLANATKHADGSSAKQLRKRNADLFRHPLLDKIGVAWSLSEEPLRLPLAGEGLFVTEEMFSEYAANVHAFVRAIILHFERNASRGYPCKAR